MKKILLIGLVLTLVLTSFACSTTQQPAANEPAATEESATAPAALESANAEPAAPESAATTAASAAPAGGYVMDPATVGSDPAKDEYYFVYIPKLIAPFYDPFIEGVTQAAEEYAQQGVTIEFDWDAPTASEATLQVTMLENAAAKKPDCIGLCVADSMVMDPIIKDVQNAGVPVVTFIDNSVSMDRMGAVGLLNYYDHGCTLAEFLAEAIDYEGQVGLLLGNLGAFAHQERSRGFRDTFAKYPGIEIVSENATDDDMEKAVSISEQLLQAYPDLRGLISAATDGPGAGRAIADVGKTGVVINATFDATEEVIDGLRNGTIDFAIGLTERSLIENGILVTKLMVDVADGKVTEPLETYEIDMTVLTPDNLAENGY